MSTTDMRASLTVTADASALVREMRKGSEGLREIRRETEAAAKAAEVAASQQGRMAAQLNRTFSNFGTGRSSAQSSAVLFEGVQQYEAFRREQADQAARAYRSIEESLNPVIRAERELAQAQGVVNRALAEGVTTNTQAAQSLAQLQSRYDAFVQSQNPAAQSARAIEAAIEAEAESIQRLTFALDPAARAQAEFARTQEMIQRAAIRGTITGSEAARLSGLVTDRQRAATGDDIDPAATYAAFQKEQADSAALAYRALEDSMDPVIRAQRELAAGQDVVNRALAQGQITNTQAARSLQQLDARFDDIRQSHSEAARSARVFEAAIEQGNRADPRTDHGCRSRSARPK